MSLQNRPLSFAAHSDSWGWEPWPSSPGHQGPSPFTLGLSFSSVHTTPEAPPASKVPDFRLQELATGR